MPKYITFLIILLSFSTIAQQKIDEELIIFVQKTTDSDFTRNNIKELEAKIQKQGISTKVIDIEQSGAPKEIGFTPFIVYRNHKGRNVFKGRYTSHKRLFNFIQTTRRLPAQSIDYKEQNVFVWKQDYANLFLKLKITDPQGSLPNTFDLKQFKKECLNGLQKGFKAARYHAKATVKDADELIYCNFYPYITADGKVYVSTELYSHYHCHTPIYQQFDAPAAGNSIAEGFAQAGKDLFTEIQRQLVASTQGDAMNYVQKKNIKSIPWANLGLKSLKKPAKTIETTIKEVVFPKEWMVASSVDNSSPILTFNFPPPLRQYSGAFNTATGYVQLTLEQSLEKAVGRFSIAVNTIEMGVESLNEVVKESILMVEEHPTAELLFKRILSKDFKLELGKITKTQIEAELILLGKPAPVLATAQFEPFLNNEGLLFLSVSTQFTVEDLSGSYQIDGPDGPKEANNKMLFNANFIMKEKE